MLYEYFNLYCNDLQITLSKLSDNDLTTLFNMIEKAYQTEHNIFILGNGGSAASASHWVCDFGKGINIDGKKRMKISAPSDNSSILTAIGNDFSYSNIFDYQLKNFAKEGDLFLALTVSGNSSNLINAFEWARQNGVATACIIGDYHGKITEYSDFTFTIQSQNYGIVEDIHIILNHIFSQYLKDLIAGDKLCV